MKTYATLQIDPQDNQEGALIMIGMVMIGMKKIYDNATLYSFELP